MGKKSKEARRARRDAQRANDDRSSVVDDEETGTTKQRNGAASDADAPKFDKSEKKTMRALQICMPEMADDTAARVMVALINETVDDPERTHAEIVKIFEDAGHEDGTAMMDTVYIYLLNDEVQDEVQKRMDSEQKEPTQNETVMVTKIKSRGRKAPGHKAHGETDMGQQARGQKASQTLGLALSSVVRQPKPRKLGLIDELVWSEAQAKAVHEVRTEMEIAVSLEEYYDQMCSVGKRLLAKEVNRKTQKIYDYKATKMFQKNKTK